MKEKLLIQSYLETSYSLDSIQETYHIGEIFDPPFDFIYKTVAWITPFNPKSKKLSLARNKNRLLRFYKQLKPFYQIHKGCTLASCEEWREEGYWIFDIAFKKAVQIAQEYQQNGFLFCQSSSPIHMYILEI